MKYLKKEIKLSFKLILMLLLINIITIGINYSYALFELSIIQNSIVVIKTATIDITTTITGYSTPSFTLNSGESKDITVNLTNNLGKDIAYKMYYQITSGSSTFTAESKTLFSNNIVEGVMNTSKTITFTFKNTGSESITIELGTQGGLKEYPITLDQGNELISTEKVVTLTDEFKTVLLSRTNSYVLEDGIYYVSGKQDDNNPATTDDIDFNYVWYSGKLWRITAINADGSLKLITQDNITTIAYGEDYNFYTDASTSSWIYQWLNEDFLDTLYNYENIIKTDSTWNVTNGDGTISTKLEATTMVSAKVGLLNSYEYYKSYVNLGGAKNGYLNVGYYWWLSNRNSTSSSNVWIVSFSGSASSYPPYRAAYGSRPSINLKSTIQLASGNGTKTDPYRIKGDKEDIVANTTLLNTRSSGEYVNFAGAKYRIVGIENNTTKLTKVDYIRDESDVVITKKVSTSVIYGSGTSEDYWDYYLNNTWYNAISSTYKNMLEKGTYYLGTVSSSSRNYKLAICASASNTVTTKECTKTSTTWTGYVGLPRYGEMFASQLGSGYSNSSYMWLITPYSTSHVWSVNDDGGLTGFNNPSSDTNGSRPSIHLKSPVKITGGSGTESSPFEISL